MLGFGILTGLLIVPLCGAAFILTLKGDDAAVASNCRWAALAATIFTFILSLVAWSRYDITSANYQMVESHAWLTDGMRFKLGVDGFSMPLILLTTFTLPICIGASWVGIQTRVKEYFVLFLVLETMVIGVFISLDLVSLYLFFEGTLIPMFLIVGIWGSKRRIYATFKFFFFTLLGSVLMLLGIIAMYWNAGTTDIELLLKHQFPAYLQTWLWLAFFAAFAVKLPKWPLHTWLLDAHVEAPTAGSVILAGILLKMGGYGFIRISLSMLPLACREFAPYVFALAICAIIFASVAAMMQADVKRLVAYSSVAHMGIVTLGLFTLTEQGIQGAWFMMISHGFISSALFLCVGVLYDRMHTREIAAYGGLVKRMPLFAFAMMVFTMANIGLPGTAGFIGEFLSLVGAFKANPSAAFFATFTVILSACYGLWVYMRVIFGKLEKPSLQNIKDLSIREILMLSPLVVVIVYYGVHPGPILETFAPSTDALVASFKTAFANVQTADAAALIPR